MRLAIFGRNLLLAQLYEMSFHLLGTYMYCVGHLDSFVRFYTLELNHMNFLLFFLYKVPWVGQRKDVSPEL